VRGAIAIFQRVHKMYPRFAKVYLRLAEALFDHGNYTSALVTLYNGRAYNIFESRLGTKLFEVCVETFL
jgi:hypothetical protein